jgi:hypothetical protein
MDFDQTNILSSMYLWAPVQGTACHSKKVPDHYNPTHMTRPGKRWRRRRFVCGVDGSADIKSVWAVVQGQKETYYFNILKLVLLRRLLVFPCSDMRHITPVVNAILLVRCNRSIVYVTPDTSSTNYLIQVVDTSRIGFIPPEIYFHGRSMAGEGCN